MIDWKIVYFAAKCMHLKNAWIISTHERRVQVLRKQGRCFNCFRRDHMVKFLQVSVSEVWWEASGSGVRNVVESIR